MIWFSSDFHLGHRNIIKYCSRPFEATEEMDAIILDNLHESTKPGDILYFLGDLTFKKKIAEAFFQRFDFLIIHYVVGNHDNEKVLQVAQQNCESVSNLKDIMVENQPITLCHYAMRVWNKSHFNAWQLFGHSHGNVEPIGKQYDVGVDTNNFSPISFTELKSHMENQPDNFNYIPPEKRR